MPPVLSQDQDGRGCVVDRKTLIMSAANLAWTDPILYYPTLSGSLLTSYKELS